MNIIETERLMIKEYTGNEIAKLYTILSDPVTMSYWPAPFTMQQTEKWIIDNLSRYDNLGYGRWRIILKDNGQLIGDCGIMMSEIDHIMVNDLGYIIHHPYWRKGFAYEAVNACKEYAFDVLQLDRLYANMPYNHDGSRKVAEKIGMKKEKEFYNSRNRNIVTNLYSISKIN